MPRLKFSSRHLGRTCPPYAPMEPVELEQEAKRRKLEDEGGMDAEFKTEREELPKEVEEDAKADVRAKLTDKITFELRDATLNVIPTLAGRLLMPLTDGGLQYLMAGARANTGIKKGRYLFEVKIVELLSPTEPAGGHHRNVPMPRQMVKVGFATQDSPVFLGLTEESVCFDSEGFFTADKQREGKGQPFGRDQIVAVLLNLEKKSPNSNTISLFRDGERMTRPLPLPECLQGKPLFPVVNFKNTSVQVNFGSPIWPLPFKCTPMQEMAKDDAEFASAVPQDGVYEVLFPVGLPDEGTFDWIDSFLAKNPKYNELSDRSIIKWAEQSGLVRPTTHTWKNSNDKPDMHFGIPMMDDFSVRRVLNSVVATQPRNYVVMEVKANLVPADRAELMKRFNFPFYKKIAHVVMGDPPEEYKAKEVLEPMLKEKQDRAEKDWKNRKAEREKKKLFELQQKKLEEARKRAEEELRKRTEEMQKAAEAAAGQEAGEEARKEPVPEEKEQKPDVEMKEEPTESKGEAVKEQPPSDSDKAAKKEEDVAMKTEDEEKKEVKEEEKDDEEEPFPVVELTPEEKALSFRKKAVPDLAGWVLGTQLTKFAMPSKEEGFAEIRYEWGSEATCTQYFKTWTLRQKVMCRMEELQPGDWFKARWTEWQKVLADWHQKQTDFQDPLKQAAKKAMEEAEEARKKAEEEAKKAEEEAKKRAEEEAKKIEAAKKVEEETGGDGEKKPEGETAQPADGTDAEKKEAPVEAEKAPEKPVEVEKPPAEAPKEEEPKPKAKPVVDDIFAVEDVSDVGGGEPLFSKFSFEDWALLSLRLELYLMVHAFAKDAGDPERVGVHESHLPFYYHKYYRKTFNVKYYGVEANVELLKMIKDTIIVGDEDAVLRTELADDVPCDLFVKLTEEGRRARERLLDAGDETVKLKFAKPQDVAAMAYQAACNAKGGSAKVGGYSPLSRGEHMQGATMVPPPPQHQVAVAAAAQSWYTGGGKGSSYGGRDERGKGPVVGGSFQKGYSSSSYGAAGKGPAVGTNFGKGSYGSYGGGKNVCRQWQSGSCSYGTQCRYAHA